MAGKGNGQAVLTILDEIIKQHKWKRFFERFTFPYAFIGTEEYGALLLDAGLEPVRIELLPRDMKFTGSEVLAGWVRTSWLPFTEQVPQCLRDDLVGEVVNRYIDYYPADTDGIVHLGMVRLEIEAKRP